MSESARVRSVLALEAVENELRRTQEWLEDQDSRWTAEIREQEEASFIAKQELARRRMMKIGERHVDCWEQEKAVRMAQQRLEFAQEKLEITRHWLRQWSSEMIEFEGPTRHLKSFMEADLVRACALLEGKAESLEKYLETAAPETNQAQP
jgi:hypothetical protein